MDPRAARRTEGGGRGSRGTETSGQACVRVTRSQGGSTCDTGSASGPRAPKVSTEPGAKDFLSVCARQDLRTGVLQGMAFLPEPHLHLVGLLALTFKKS